MANSEKKTLQLTSDNSEIQTAEVEQKSDNDNMETIKWCSSLYISYFGNIDSTNQTFDVSLKYIYYRQLTQNEKIMYQDKDKKFTDFVPEFGLRLNALGAVSLQSEQWNFAPNDGENRYYCVGTESSRGETLQLGGLDTLDTLGLEKGWTLTGTFIESLELESFPFDVQHFQMTFQFNETGRDEYKKRNPGKCVQFEFVEKNSEYAARIGFFNLMGWTFEGIAVSGYAYANAEQSNPDKKLKKININVGDWCWYRVLLRRDWLFYFWRIVFVLMVISLISVVVFLFDNDGNVGNRFGFLSTMLLTVVAYQFVISQYLPVLNYLTLLDKYILFVVVFILIICFEVVGIYFYYEAKDNEFDEVIDTRNGDFIFLIIDLTLWIMVHIYFIVMAVIYHRTETKKINKTKSEVDKGSIFQLEKYNIQRKKKDSMIKQLNWDNTETDQNRNYNVYASYTTLKK